MVQGFHLPSPLPPVYFVQLQLRDDRNKVRSRNFYWRSSLKGGDLTELRKLPYVILESSQQLAKEGTNYVFTLTLTNPESSGAVAFFIRLKLLEQSSAPDTDRRVLPVFYTDNYFSLLPGETKTVTIDCARKDSPRAEPELWIEGWNVKLVRVAR